MNPRVRSGGRIDLHPGPELRIESIDLAGRDEERPEGHLAHRAMRGVRVGAQLDPVAGHPSVAIRGRLDEPLTDPDLRRRGQREAGPDPLLAGREDRSAIGELRDDAVIGAGTGADVDAVAGDRGDTGKPGLIDQRCATRAL